MGYTHYFTIKDTITDDEFNEFIYDVERIIANSYVTICNWEGVGEPIITSDEVTFNGCQADGDDYETFSIVKNSSGFGFCKTARRPYDKVVVACLIASKKAFGSKIECGSDGRCYGDIENGVELFKLVCSEDSEKFIDLFIQDLEWEDDEDE